MRTRSLLLLVVLISIMLLAFALPALAQGEPALDHPILEAHLDQDWIGGWGFPLDTTVTVRVNGGTKGTRDVRTEPNGSIMAENWSGGDEVAPGDRITASYDASTTEMTVAALQVDVDVKTDTISGTATLDGNPMESKLVWIRIVNNWQDVEALVDTATVVKADGSFNFSLSPFDLLFGQKIRVTVSDDPAGSYEGNNTTREPRNEAPSLGIHLDYQWIDANDLPPEATSTIKVNGGVKGSRDVLADADGAAHLDDWFGATGHRISPGDAVTIHSEDETLCSLTVWDVDTWVNVASNQVLGGAFFASGIPLAESKTELAVREAGSGSDVFHAEGTVNPDGSFSFDANPTDLAYGQCIEVGVFEPEPGSRDRIYRNALNPIPTRLSASVRRLSGAYGGFAAFEATLNPLAGPPLQDRALFLEKSLDGVQWVFCDFAWWDWASLSYKTQQPITGRAFYRFRFVGDEEFGSSVSGPLVFAQRAFLSQPTPIPTNPRRNIYFVISGYLKPRHSGYTRLIIYRMVAGHMYFWRNVSARNTNYASYTRYAARLSLPYRGTWTVRAYHADSSHLTTNSQTHFFLVR